MTAPIFPKIIYPIGNLPDGKYYVIVEKSNFSYCRDLPNLDTNPGILLPSIFDEEDWEDTDLDIHIEWDVSLDKAS
jgi:hypothetical protein